MSQCVKKNPLAKSGNVAEVTIPLNTWFPADPQHPIPDLVPWMTFLWHFYLPLFLLPKQTQTLNIPKFEAADKISFHLFFLSYSSSFALSMVQKLGMKSSSRLPIKVSNFTIRHIYSTIIQ